MTPLTKEEVLGYIEGALDGRGVWSIETDVEHYDPIEGVPKRLERSCTITLHLTPPAPQATITLADGRSVTVDEDVLRWLVKLWGTSTEHYDEWCDLNDLFTGTDGWPTL